MNILLFDNGSKYLDELRSLLERYGEVKVTKTLSEVEPASFQLVVFSGGSGGSVISHTEEYQPEISYLRTTQVPTLGICLGAELIAYTFGATLEYLNQPETGLRTIKVLIESQIFKGISSFEVYESHKWAITKISDDLEGLARSDSGFEVIRHKTRPIYGFQLYLK